MDIILGADRRLEKRQKLRIKFQSWYRKEKRRWKILAGGNRALILNRIILRWSTGMITAIGRQASEKEPRFYSTRITIRSINRTTMLIAKSVSCNISGSLKTAGIANGVKDDDYSAKTTANYSSRAGILARHPSLEKGGLSGLRNIGNTVSFR
jgi:hypothetical protein